MKTAMEEAIKLVKEYNNRKIPYNVLLGNLELALEKEKEQIIDAVEFGLFNMHTTIDGKYYYDLKYNKNK